MIDGVDAVTLMVVCPSVPGVPEIVTPVVSSVPPVVCIPSCVSENLNGWFALDESL